MEVGDLVSWENADEECELGVVIHFEGAESLNVMVYFPKDSCPSWITRSDLEVINESR